jgi:hypothetical protein
MEMDSRGLLHASSLLFHGINKQNPEVTVSISAVSGENRTNCLKQCPSTMHWNYFSSCSRCYDSLMAGEMPGQVSVWLRVFLPWRWRWYIPPKCRFISVDPHVVISQKTIFLNVRFEVFTVVTMENGFFWDVTLCGSYNNGRFGGT